MRKRTKPQRAMGEEPAANLRQFIAEIDGLCNCSGQSRYAVFSDWLKMMVCSFALGQMEAEYLEAIRRYEPETERGKLILNDFAKMAGMLVLAIEAAPDSDPLGELWMECLSDGWRGQFFTPWNICSLMAKMAIGDVPEGDRDFWISDPACGSGRMLLAAAREVPTEHLHRVVLHAQDVDADCCLMATVNFSLLGLKAYVVCGDSLRAEPPRFVYRTRWGGIHGAVCAYTAAMYYDALPRAERPDPARSGMEPHPEPDRPPNEAPGVPEAIDPTTITLRQPTLFDLGAEL